MKHSEEIYIHGLIQITFLINISNPQVWPDSTTTFKVLASDINTCLDTAEITVNVNPMSVIDMKPTSIFVW